MDYIADKELFKAVMFARKMVRETGYFNKSCRTAANYYGVDEADIAKYVRQAQSDGRKKKAKPSANKGKKLKYFIVQKQSTCDATGTWNACEEAKIVKGYGAESVVKKYTDLDYQESARNDYGGSYSPVFAHFVLGDKDGYATQMEAETVLKEMICCD